MKVLVSWLRDFVDVTASPEEIAKTMSVRGFAVEGLEHIDWDSSETRIAKADAVIDFEVTGNRPDCMCVMGMAREIATAFSLPMRRPVARGKSGDDEDGSSLRLVSLKAVDKGYGFGIVGVTGGHPFSQNGCLGAEWSWATSSGSGGGLYVNLAAASFGQPVGEIGHGGDDGVCLMVRVLRKQVSGRRGCGGQSGPLSSIRTRAAPPLVTPKA